MDYCLKITHSAPDHTIQKMNTTPNTMSVVPRMSWVFAGSLIPNLNNGCALPARWRLTRLIPTIVMTIANRNTAKMIKNNPSTTILAFDRSHKLTPYYYKLTSAAGLPPASELCALRLPTRRATEKNATAKSATTPRLPKYVASTSPLRPPSVRHMTASLYQ